jgi:hypothetical protein
VANIHWNCGQFTRISSEALKLNFRPRALLVDVPLSKMSTYSCQEIKKEDVS